MVAQLFYKNQELVLATILIVTGVVYLLFAQDIQDFASIEDWWPMIKNWSNMVVEELKNLI